MAHSDIGTRDRSSTRAARRSRSAALGAKFFAVLLSFLQLVSAGRAQAASVEESGVDLLTFHRTNYFVTGFTDDTQVKFQFSFKYDLWPNRSEHNVYFAYTQKSLWDLYLESSPFRESNYNPQVFYSHRHAAAARAHPGFTLVSEQAGFDHESNGEDGDRSRSWNRVFAAGSAACVDGRGRFIGWGVQVWLPFALRDNDDIIDYAGLGEFHLRAGVMDTERWWGSGELMLAGRKGTNTHGSLLAELSWRLGYRGAFARAVRFAPFLFVQLFTGQGETLLRYDQTDRSVRVGIALRDRTPLRE
jgi:outer membrane phospholipase A